LKKNILILACLLYICFNGLSQNVTISGIPNHYLRVDSVLPDRVRVSDLVGGELAHFVPGDVVMLIQMTGITAYTSGNYMTGSTRSRGSINHAGTYEILQVDEVIEILGKTYIVFTDDISRVYDDGERMQLVKFVLGENVATSGNVTAMDWDSTTGVGGIVGIIGMDTVTLNHTIDVSAKGFHGGAVPQENYDQGGLCRKDPSPPTVLDTMYFLPTQLYRSGNKGEGAINVDWPYTKGKSYNINGGGAGNGKYSGGGGGSNYNAGGDGGRQSSECAEELMGGWGGYACQSLYTYTNRQIIMGGGGGSGTRLSTATPSPGGDGGGIIIIITGILKGNGKTVSANGEGAMTTTGSGGGGGAGGTILIDATGYSGTFNINIKGGKGANTNNSVYCTGTGGGGSGGVLWYSGTSIQATIDSSAGAWGTSLSGCITRLGSGGYKGVTIRNLLTPLTGFLFNSIRGTDTICYGQQPGLLEASQPKGGDGTYTYYWEESNNDIDWITAAGTKALRTLQPPVLTQTTYYRRVVTSAGIFDTSRVVKVFVYPAIGNNSITGTDTICYNDNAGSISGLQPSGGNNLTYTYQWQVSNNTTTWSDGGTVLQTNIPFAPGQLTESKYFRRVVTSTAYCVDTSNSVRIAVLPLISGNGFVTGADTAICMSQSPGQLSATTPGGGDGLYNYLWQFREQAGTWTDIPSSNVLRFTAGTLTDTTRFRRIVFSGNDNACIDTSGSKTIIVLPPVSNNIIACDPVQYTCYNTSVSLPGSQPQNGDGTYSYKWEKSTDNIAWTDASGSGIDYTTANLVTPGYYRRIVYSSATIKQCSNTSDEVEVRINPLPVGDILNSIDTICQGETIQVTYNISGNGPFNITIGGITKQSSIGIDSIAFTPNATIPYVVSNIVDDSTCQADAANFEGIARVVVYEIPQANAGNDDETCGDTYTLHAVKSIPGSDGLWTASNATFNGPDDTGSDVTVQNYGTNSFTWTETNWQCTDADEVEITFFEQPQEADAGADQSLDFTYTTQLQAVMPAVGTGEWSVIQGTGIFDDPALPNATVSELSDLSRMRWTVTNSDNCEAITDSMSVTVNPLQVTKGFTPNGDNRNDLFEIGAIHAEKISIRIFNSAGTLVFESDDYLNGDKWNGHNMNGVELPEGTYYYIMNVKTAGRTDEVQFRSFIEILR
jgi:gliding motility-associated-like protein